MIDVVVGHADDLVRGLVRSALEDDGCHVREAASSSAVLSACREQPPDVVVVDVTLCQKEHTPLLNRLKQDPVLFPVAVVLLADANAPRDVLRTLDQGAQDVVLLPLRGADVIARVRAAARTKALQEEFLKRGRTMEDLVYGDPLTGLHNRRFILTQLNSLVASARRHERELSAVVIDVDGFKGLNDELGHAAGDAALVEISARLKRRVRREDFVGRLGGEEFLVLLPDTSSREAARVAEDLRLAVADRPMVLEGLSRTMTVSAGWATWAGEAPDELLRRADQAMYRAKEAGRNRVCGAAFATSAST
jgi:diguanylate cyclase (GGDEF)-like protein